MPFCVQKHFAFNTVCEGALSWWRNQSLIIGRTSIGQKVFFAQSCTTTSKREGETANWLFSPEKRNDIYAYVYANLYANVYVYYICKQKYGKDDQAQMRRDFYRWMKSSSIEMVPRLQTTWFRGMGDREKPEREAILYRAQTQHWSMRRAISGVSGATE